MHSDLKYLQELTSWSEKYEFILELGSKSKKLNESQKTNENRIFGCQSRVWLILTYTERLNIEAEADSRLVQGLLALVVLNYNNKTKNEINSMQTNWIKELGLDQNLSLVRRQGLDSVVQAIMNFCQS
jgi:cysteine desulfuration protein SufE